MSAGVVLNPATPLGSLEEILGVADFILVMSVNPGFGGQTFISSSLGKVASLRQIISRRAPGTRIEVDGGVTADNAGELVRAGAEILVAGNAVYGKGDPTENTREILSRMHEADQ